MVTHRTLAGGWALCADPAFCKLLFHFPDTTPALMAALPERAVWALCEVIDPPTRDMRAAGGPKAWTDTEDLVHRDYDLPAAFGLQDEAQWFRHGERHREVGPAVIHADGTEVYYRDNTFTSAKRTPGHDPYSGYVDDLGIS